MIKFWVALIAASASLAVAIFSHFSSRENQTALEKLRRRFDEEDAERDAKRDYEYDARKRLYEQCGPILFQLVEHCEAAYFGITGIAQTAKIKNLEAGRGAFLRDSYYHTSTLYRLLAPSAALKLLQRRLTLVDLSLDLLMLRQYTLAREAFFAFGGEMRFARLERAIDYQPFDKHAEEKARADPATFYRQGLPLGVFEGAIESLLSPNGAQEVRLLTYAECEAEYEKKDSNLRQQFDGISFLIDDFHPRCRPIFWRMLVTQACIYRALFQQSELGKPGWSLANLEIPVSEREKFDWRSERDEKVTGAQVFEPLKVAEKYFADRLAARLDRIAKA